MNLPQQHIHYEKGRGQHENRQRTVHNVALTGHVAKTWGGTRKYQWSGWIFWYGERVTVYGYSESPASKPTEWSNDTY